SRVPFGVLTCRHRAQESPVPNGISQTDNCGPFVYRSGSRPRSSRMSRTASVATIVFVLSCLILFPVRASAQATGVIAGLVKDSSGAVLPGVTVEAASPALIEKVRTAVTDGQGQYRI